ncbi:BZ3500_MvSof-1268-A1-R1_Chr7-1g09155 [Microbotryum saponariae]|uniref:BZ3500_MvSof-1268-A1-R1_Chr7-1g09155 protein n=1 Tax=Microbotryum saponariae TaxID=289078 RepID=A0A2X0LHP9_9BASI|nr:BZ3501_MvSof-1269-A2-R1_Chr7-1g08860 [Microbotryum saponariae]SDA02900.1 BZ3500_MvSof-1268-A1-R1_Chr7-1g09155 [Microbotryum saponariae]
MAPIKVAAIQASSCAYSLDESLGRLWTLTKEASDEGRAQLLVFPEAFLSAYPRHLGFAIGSRTQEQRDWYARYLESAVKIPPGAMGQRYGDQYRSETREAAANDSDEFRAFRRICSIAEVFKVVCSVNTMRWTRKRRTETSFLAHPFSQFLSVGIIERSLVGATLWCSNILVSPEGRLLSLHRKLQPTACERKFYISGFVLVRSQLKTLMTVSFTGVVWSQGHAWNTQQESNLQVVDTSIGKIGGLICWENFMPLPRYALYQKGVEMYVEKPALPCSCTRMSDDLKFAFLERSSWTAPTADARPTWTPSMQHIAQEGRCFVISANQYHKPSDYPADYPANALPARAPEAAEAEVWSRGGSVIVDPLGTILAGPVWDEEGILYAEIDVSSIPGTKLDFDPVGHYAREDLFNFSVPTDHA